MTFAPQIESSTWDFPGGSVRSSNLPEITKDLLFTFQDLLEFLNDDQQLVRTSCFQSGSTQLSPALVFSFKPDAALKRDAGWLAGWGRTVVMPTVNYDFDVSRSLQVNVRRSHRYESKQRNCGRSRPPGIFVIKTLSMIVFSERVKG